MEDKTYLAAVELRRELHAHPELSMEENWTKGRLMDFLRQNTHFEIVDKGRWFYALCRGTKGGPAIAFRADMDAVAVAEAPELLPYASQRPGAGHKCGHDGHCASLAALALELEEKGTERTVILLFQHAEETGQGAKECVALFEEQRVGEIYAFHNYPGLPLGSVAVPKGTAQPASTGMILRFVGKPSHASYPEDGRNPAFAIAALVSALPDLVEELRKGPYGNGLILATVIHMNVGEGAFGVSPGYGELMFTLRAEEGAALEALCADLEALALAKGKEQGLEVSFAYEEAFPATQNHPACAEKVLAVAEELGIPATDRMELFRASEDFGYYTQRCPGAMFYLGAGDCPALHTPEYDFPDILIKEAAAIFLALTKQP